jgi:hypothetical protein
MTVKFRESATAVAGMPGHGPDGIGKTRAALPPKRDGGPKAPVNPLPRVSTTLHGGRAIKGRGVDGSARVSREAEEAASPPLKAATSPESVRTSLEGDIQ